MLVKTVERHEKFCWINFNKIQRFLLDQDEFGKNHRQAHQNVSENLNIDQYSKGQILAYIISGPIYQSVSDINQDPQYSQSNVFAVSHKAFSFTVLL